MMMKQLSLVACLLFVAASALDTQREFGDLDQEDNVDEDEFEKDFGLERITDPVEKARRSIALKENEEKVKIENEDYIEGKKTWWSEIDDFDDLPEDEFEAEKTGLNQPKYGRGLLRAYGPESRDEASERYFDRFRNSNDDVPESYSSVEEGNVTPVRNQKTCGSCVAFANLAAIETCFKKITGVFGDYSEQQLVDCGFGQFGANGCSGAQPWAYTKFIVEKKFNMTHESRYPYLNMSPRYTCPNLDPKYKNRINNCKKYGEKCTKSCGLCKGMTPHASNKCPDVWKDSCPKRAKQGKCWKKKYIENCCLSCGLGEGMTPHPSHTCYDYYENCAEKRERSCSKYSAKCKKTCGLC